MDYRSRRKQSLACILLGLAVLAGASQGQWAQKYSEHELYREAQSVLHGLAERPHRIPPSSRSKAPAAAQISCLPTCAAEDGRFLTIGGGSMEMLSGKGLKVQIVVPGDAASFQVDVFDGDSGAGQGEWDLGLGAIYHYTLLADPDGDGSGTQVVEMEAGKSFIPSDEMINADWRQLTIPTDAAARSGSGDFIYELRIELPSDASALNRFKLRTDGQLAIRRGEPFSVTAGWGLAVSDLQILFPTINLDDPHQLPDPLETTFDGTFSLFFEVEADETQLIVWDGDMDYGAFDGSTQDTDDQDTSLPPAGGVAGIAEGALPGIPADDGDAADLGFYFVRSPSVSYSVVFPNGDDLHWNANPSGDGEWEGFRLSKGTILDAEIMDVVVPDLPSGIYEVAISGLDLQNGVSFQLSGRVVGVNAAGAPPRAPVIFADDFEDGSLTDWEIGL